MLTLHLGRLPSLHLKSVMVETRVDGTAPWHWSYPRSLCLCVPAELLCAVEQLHFPHPHPHPPPPPPRCLEEVLLQQPQPPAQDPHQHPLRTLHGRSR